jgi:LPXTG-motif cell wall-anchored protein
VIVAVVLSALAWASFTTAALAAGSYPPVPGPPTVGVPQVPVKVVVVKGVPVRPRVPIVRTGTSSTVPLLALGLGSVVVGTTLVGLSRRRRSAELLSDAPSS